MDWIDCPSIPGGVRKAEQYFGTDIGFRQTGYVYPVMRSKLAGSAVTLSCPIAPLLTRDGGAKSTEWPHTHPADANLRHMTSTVSDAFFRER